MLEAKKLKFIYCIAIAAISAGFGVLLYVQEKISIEQALVLLVFISLLALACKSDFDTRTIDFKLSYMLILVGLFYQIAGMDIKLVIKAIATAVLCLILLIICSMILNKSTSKESLGRGDLRTMPSIALVLNYLVCFTSLFAACLISLIAIFIFQKITKRKLENFPFCPVIFLWLSIGLLFLNIV